MKKLLSLLLIVTILCTGMATFASGLVKANLLVNSDMELIGTTYTYWVGGGNSDRTSTDIYQDGSRALKFSSTTNEPQVVYQDLYEVMPGQQYTFSGSLYVKELLELGENIGGGMQVFFYKADGSMLEDEIAAMYFAPEETETWVPCSMQVVIPACAVMAKVQLRLECGGTIYWDNVTFTGITTEENAAKVQAKQDAATYHWTHSCELLEAELAKGEAAEIMPGIVNAVANAGFEDGEGGVAANWIAKSDRWNDLITRSDDYSHSGKYSLKISTEDKDEGRYNPWVQHSIESNLVSNTDYVLSAWVKVENIEPLRGPLMKIEAYGTNKESAVSYTGGAQTNVFSFNDNDWHQIKLLYTLPEGTTCAKLYLRMNGAGTIYFDDVEFGPTGTSKELNFYTKHKFFYTDWENIEAFAEIDYINHPIANGSYVEFSIKDGETVIAEQQVPAASKVSAVFPVMTLAEKAKKYTIEATYKAADGSVITEPQTKTIYRYDRPTMLDEEGRFVENGEVLDIFYLYGADANYLAGYKEAGISVVRLNDVRMRHDNIPRIRALFDEIHSHGLKVLFPLYGRCAGHPLQIETTIKLVTELKDHPALIGWMMVDEPSMHAKPSGEVQTYTEMLEHLETAYTLIRSIDPDHPVYNIETTGVPNSYEQAFQYVDIAAIDPYPTYENETYYTYKRMTDAVDAVFDEKQVWNLGYGASWDPTYVPDADALRMQSYLSLWAGGSGIGYYTSAEFSPTLIDVYKKVKESGELEQMFDHFVRKNSPVFDEYIGADFWYRSWIDDDGKMYLLVKEHKNDGTETPVNFNLVSANGKIEINGFSARLINGTTAETVISDNSTFSLSLKPRQISLYEITPNEAVDFSSVNEPVYTDLDGYDWAKDAIETVTTKGIANKKGVGIYAPGENITRGDFAMYLIRTLGLEAEVSDQFSDVDPNSYYAKEIAIGKALGILKGSGDGTYAPEEPISRQDLMVICARGLRYLNRIASSNPDSVLGSFSDTGAIADYAIQDVAAMVSARFISGNADLTINPLGNTTRAEAAVIMDRIAH